MAITNKAAVENYLLIDIDETFDSQLDEWIEAVEAYMNKKTDRILMADETPQTYYYDGTKRDYIRIDDFFDIDSITDVDSDTLYSADDYILLPYNSTYKDKVELTSGYWTEGRRKIKIVGRRGRYTEETLPGDLKFAATVLLAGIIGHAHQHKGEVKQESIGRYSVTYATTSEQKANAMEVEDILRSYRKMR